MSQAATEQQKTSATSQGTTQAKKAKTPGVFRSFLTYYKPQMHLFVLDIICAVIVAAVDLAFPQILRKLTGGLFTQGAEVIFQALGFITVGLIVMYGIRFYCRYFVAFWGHVMGARMESEMRQDLFNAYERFSFAFFDKHKSGDLMSRVISDLFDISEAAHHGPEFILIGAVEIIGSFIIMWTIDIPLSAVLLAITAVLVAYNIYANFNMRAVFTQNRVRIAGVNSRIEDSLAGVRVVKGFAAEELEKRKFAHANEAYLESKILMYRAMGRYQSAIALLTGALYTAIIVVGAIRVANGDMYAVDLATYALYITVFVNPITNILNFTETFQKALAGFKRFREVLDAVPDVEDAPNAQPLTVTDGAILYKDVCFSYDKEQDVLRELNLTIEPGKTVALVGPSGGGKSTICALLPRFYDIDSGSITIDGQDVRDVTLKSLRSSIGLVQQDVYLFDGTIAENIAYGKPSATFDEIKDAAQKANIAEFIESLPEGYETQVGERGSHLSGGQRQRIAIARVFLKNPAILILDEATSALDNESEAAVQESLARLATGRTTLVIAHRLSTIRNANVIVTIQDGKVAEQGTHAELLAKNGIYAHYYRMQFEGGFAALTE